MNNSNEQAILVRLMHNEFTIKGEVSVIKYTVREKKSPTKVLMGVTKVRWCISKGKS